MKHGIYYAYWEKEWKGDYIHYIKKVAGLGFDVLEIAAGPLPDYTDAQLLELRNCAEEYGIQLTVGYGPSQDTNIGSADPAIREKALAYYTDLFQRMEKINANVLCGGIYSYWPLDPTKTADKAGEWTRGAEGIAKLSVIAQEYGVSTLGMEVMNRFDTLLLNTAKEGVQFVNDVLAIEPKASNVKIHLDTFHMNIEEQSMGDAILTAGSLLGHLHSGEGNRMVSGQGKMPWNEIGHALRKINYQGAVVMEPFVMPGGTVGSDLKIWRQLVDDISDEALDRDAKNALIFQRYMLDGE